MKQEKIIIKGNEDQMTDLIHSAMNESGLIQKNLKVLAERKNLLMYPELPRIEGIRAKLALFAKLQTVPELLSSGLSIDDVEKLITILEECIELINQNLLEVSELFRIGEITVKIKKTIGEYQLKTAQEKQDYQGKTISSTPEEIAIQECQHTKEKLVTVLQILNEAPPMSNIQLATGT